LGDQDWGLFVEEIVAVGRPWPIFGMGGEASCDWIAVHVLQLFDSLVIGDDVEVVVARLPEGALSEVSGDGDL